MYNKKFLFGLLISLFIYVSGQAQCLMIPIPLEDRIEASELIVLGKVGEQQSFRRTGTNKLYTAHKITITAFLKGNLPDSQLVLITEGGLIDGEAQIVQPALVLDESQEGVFMLQQHTFAGNPFSNFNTYETYASLQGALLLKSGFYTDEMYEGNFTETSLLNLFKEKTGIAATTFHKEVYKARATEINIGNRITAANITSVSPNPVIAGTIDNAQILIIKGSGFGSTRGIVEFSNADDGGKTYIQSSIPTTDITSWSDSEIRIKVPREAGTGNVRVNGSAAAPLTVKFATLEVNDKFYDFSSATRQKIILVNRNQLGGYTFYYSNNFIGNEAAVAAFEKAIQNWRCATGMNYRIGGKLVPQTAASNDQIGLVSFDPTLPAGILGRATSYYAGKGSSVCSQGQTVWYTDEIDMVFSANLPGGFTWNFGPDASVANAKTYDFESVTLHELGHAHGLGHIIDASKVMHYSLNNGIDKRKLADVDIEGGLYKINQSTQTTLCLLPDSVAGTIQKVPTAQCALPAELVLFQGQYNQVRGNVLNWQTAFEYDTDGFTIMKSKDGVTFDSLTYEPSLGTGPSTRNYTLIDTANIDSDSYYYQLKVKRNNNSDRWSEVVKIEVPGGAGFLVYPTAVEQPEITLQPHKIQAGPVTFKLFDAFGRNVLTREFTLTTAGQKLKFDLPAVEWGMYIYQVTSGEAKTTGKMYINLK